MSGETEKNVSGWTVDTSHAHLLEKLNSLARKLDERSLAQLRELETAFAAQKEAIKVALEAVAATAVIHGDAHEREHANHERTHQVEKEGRITDKASMDKRLEAMNEFRNQLREQAGTFTTRELFDTERQVAFQRHEAMREIIGALQTRVTTAESRDAGGDAQRQSLRGFIMASAAIITVILSIVVLLANKSLGG